MRDAAVSIGLLTILALVGLGVLTAIGASKRGAGASLALLEGLGFPLAWIAWYVRDCRKVSDRPGISRLPEA